MTIWGVLIQPLQGCIWSSPCGPGALPWAVLLCPFGARTFGVIWRTKIEMARKKRVENQRWQGHPHGVRDEVGICPMDLK